MLIFVNKFKNSISEGPVMKTIVFDVDDTLYDLMTPFKKAVQRVFSVDYQLEDIEQLFQYFRYHSDLLFPDTETGKLPVEKMRIKRIMLAFDSINQPINQPLAVLFQEAYEIEQAQIELDPKMLEVLSWLKHHNINMAVLTNGPTQHQALKISQLGLNQFIPCQQIFISEEVGLSKPDPRVFRYIEMVLGLSQAQDIIYIGDSFENDVIGSQSAGWQTIWLNKYRKNRSKHNYQPNYELTNGNSLLELLKKLISQ